MTWAVTFGGTTIVSNTSGVYQYTPGVMQPRLQFDAAPRSLGEIPKALGVSGTDHRLEVTFVGVTAASVAGVVSAMQALATGMATGTLAVPGYASVPNCVVSAVTPGRFELRGSGNAPYTTKCYDMGYSVTFRQVGG